MIFFFITLIAGMVLGAALTVWCGLLVEDDDRIADHQSKLEFNKLRGDKISPQYYGDNGCAGCYYITEHNCNRCVLCRRAYPEGWTKEKGENR